MKRAIEAAHEAVGDPRLRTQVSMPFRINRLVEIKDILPADQSARVFSGTAAETQ